MFSKECKYLLYGGAMAGGKSFFLRWAAIMYLIYIYKKYKIKGVEVGLFSEDYPTLKDRQISKIQREVPEWVGKLKEDKVHGLCFQLVESLGGGLILLRNLDDPGKYMSSEFAAIFVDELTRNSEETFMDLRNRMRYPGISEPKFVGATNPGGIGHGWVKRMFVDKNSSDPEQTRFFYIHANAYDNKFISPTYLKQLESLPPEKRKAYLEGSWDIFAGQFFPEFSRASHQVNPISPSGKYTHFGSMDWGYSAPFCFLSHIIKQEKFEGVAFNRIITYNEIYAKQKSPEDVARLIEKQGTQGFSFIRCDPAMFHKISDGSMSIADQMKTKMIDGYLLKPANNDRIGGWAIMHNWLSLAPDGLPYWLIGSNCKNLIRTLPQLVYDENNIEDCDSAGEDHAPDAARYGLVHVKFIDAKVGGVGETYKKKHMETAVMIDGKQVGLDLDLFASAWSRKQRKVYYK
jgi:phage terminase large subunit